MCGDLQVGSIIEMQYEPVDDLLRWIIPTKGYEKYL